jgi:hypothetical protein
MALVVHASRAIENSLAVLGGIIAAGYVVGAEILPRYLQRPDGCPHGVPWGVVTLAAACIAPKTLGRATAGRIYTAFASRAPAPVPPPAGRPPDPPHID